MPRLLAEDTYSVFVQYLVKTFATFSTYTSLKSEIVRVETSQLEKYVNSIGKFYGLPLLHALEQVTLFIKSATFFFSKISREQAEFSQLLLQQLII